MSITIGPGVLIALVSVPLLDLFKEQYRSQIGHEPAPDGPGFVILSLCLLVLFSLAVAPRTTK